MSIEQEFADKLVQYKHIIYKVCFMYADNKDDVNDLFQESVFNIWKSYKNFRGESSFVTWVYRISLNTCISDFRKKKKYDYVPLEQQVDILYNPQIEMFARFKMKSSFHKTKRII